MRSKAGVFLFTASTSGHYCKSLPWRLWHGMPSLVQALVQLPSVSVARATMRHFEEDEEARIGSRRVYINYSHSRSIESREGESNNSGLDLGRAINAARAGGAGMGIDVAQHVRKICRAISCCVRRLHSTCACGVARHQPFVFFYEGRRPSSGASLRAMILLGSVAGFQLVLQPTKLTNP